MLMRCWRRLIQALEPDVGEPDMGEPGAKSTASQMPELDVEAERCNKNSREVAGRLAATIPKRLCPAITVGTQNGS
jgi:hypothetical protein